MVGDIRYGEPHVVAILYTGSGASLDMLPVRVLAERLDVNAPVGNSSVGDRGQHPGVGIVAAHAHSSVLRHARRKPLRHASWHARGKRAASGYCRRTVRTRSLIDV